MAPDTTKTSSPPGHTLVLSGGGLKGLAHIGVFRALEERGILPNTVVGSSMGSLIAASWASGTLIREMEDRALVLRRSDVFKIAHVDMALRRMLSPAVYRREPLDKILSDLLGTLTFRDLPKRLIVNTVDLNSGNQILWGLPGLDDVPVADAVFASCALPGILPPRRIRGHLCADGAVIENLPVRTAAAVGGGPIIAVDLGGGRTPRHGIDRTGFAATYSRGLELVMSRLVEDSLRLWNGPPLVLIRPQVKRASMFSFNKTPFLIAEGYRATMEALDRLHAPLDKLGEGIHPRFQISLQVNRERCIGCGICAGVRPHLFRMANGKAEAIVRSQDWAPVNDVIERMCPVGAIRTETLEEPA